MSISRRRFLESTALGGLAAGVTNAAEIGKDHKLPTRVLGKTGARVSILAFGGGSRFLMYKDEDKALEAVNRALDMGITYMDTAYGYGNGRSEERIGKVMKTRRKGIFVATKIDKRDGNEAMKTSFQTVALPVANRKKMGVIAMKIFAQEGLLDQAPLEKLMYYSLSLPVTLVTVGMPKLEYIEHNVALAKAYKPMPKPEMQELSQRLSEKNKAAFDRFLSTHIDA